MENDLALARKKKLEYVIEKRKIPYPKRYEVNYQLTDAGKLSDGTQNVRVARRITLMLKRGNIFFARISDVYGSIRIAVKRDLRGNEEYDFFKNAFDIGDFIGVCGEMFNTNTREKTIRAHEITFLGKVLRPLPEKYHGMTDTDSRFRQRYLDLIMNKDAKKKFLLKFSFIREVRRYLEDHG